MKLQLIEICCYSNALRTDTMSTLDIFPRERLQNILKEEAISVKLVHQTVKLNREH